MRRLLAGGAIVLAFALQRCDPADGSAAEGSRAPGPGATYSTTGEITALANDWVTIDHQPVTALGWPAMTMTFKAQDSAMMSGLRTGAVVEFSFRQDGSDNVLTGIRPR